MMLTRKTAPCLLSRPPHHSDSGAQASMYKPWDHFSATALGPRTKTQFSTREQVPPRWVSIPWPQLGASAAPGAVRKCSSETGWAWTDAQVWRHTTGDGGWACGSSSHLRVFPLSPSVILSYRISFYAEGSPLLSPLSWLVYCQLDMLVWFGKRDSDVRKWSIRRSIMCFLS